MKWNRKLNRSSFRNLPDEGGKIVIDGKKYDYSFKDELVSGLTGYYQLNKDERALENYTQFIIEGIELDNRYYQELKRNSCLKMMLADVSIIFKTLLIVWQAKGV